MASNFEKLLDFGYLPKELPPVFRTRGYSAWGASFIARGTLKGYKGRTTFFDGKTYAGGPRTFGIINPINYAHLANHIHDNWAEISRHLRKSNSSLSAIRFNPAANTHSRALKATRVSERLLKERALHASFPALVARDINRFYGSIYTHSIPWAIQGKEAAKRRVATNARPFTWDEELDRFARNGNDAQTIGIPVGPDTSRIISEVILAAIDQQLKAAGARVPASSFLHSIDDYQFGVMDPAQADQVASRFERAIRAFELRSNEFKSTYTVGPYSRPLGWQHSFDVLDRPSRPDLNLAAFFELLWEKRLAYPRENVVAYAFGRYRRQIARHNDRADALAGVQHLLFSDPHLVVWLGPYFAGLLGRGALDAGQERLLSWGIVQSARRGDILSVLWYLWLIRRAQLELNRSAFGTLLGLKNSLVDVMLSQLEEAGLANVARDEIKDRLSEGSFADETWLVAYCYHSRRKRRPGELPNDPNGEYLGMLRSGVSFFQSDLLSVEDTSLGMREDEFNLAEETDEDYWEYQGDEDWDY